MKNVLAAVGIAVSLLSFIIQVNSRPGSDVALGSWLLASAALIAAALWSPPKRDSHYYAYAGKIYGTLAGGGLSFAKLIEEVASGSYGDQVAEYATKVAVTMLDEGTLVIRDGNVCLASVSSSGGGRA